jgi:hypothetical protein
MAKSIIGRNGSMGAPSTFSSGPAQPHWNRATTTP